MRSSTLTLLSLLPPSKPSETRIDVREVGRSRTCELERPSAGNWLHLLAFGAPSDSSDDPDGLFLLSINKERREREWVLKDPYLPIRGRPAVSDCLGRYSSSDIQSPRAEEAILARCRRTHPFGGPKNREPSVEGIAFRLADGVDVAGEVRR